MKPWHRVIGELVFGKHWYDAEPYLQRAYRRGWVEGTLCWWPLGILVIVVGIFFFWSLSI